MPYSHDCLQIMLALVQYWMGQQQLLPRQKQACMFTCMQCMDIRACILSAVRQHRVSVGFIQCGPCVHVCTLSTGPLFVYFIPVICTQYTIYIQIHTVPLYSWKEFFFELIRPFFDVLFVLQLWSLLFYTHADPDKNLVQFVKHKILNFKFKNL